MQTSTHRFVSIFYVYYVTFFCLFIGYVCEGGGSALQAAVRLVGGGLDGSAGGDAARRSGLGRLAGPADLHPHAQDTLRNIRHNIRTTQSLPAASSIA